MKSTVSCLILVAATLAPAFVQAGSPEQLTGVDLRVEPDPSDPALLHCSVLWTEPAPLARVRVRGPLGTAVLGGPGWVTGEGNDQAWSTALEQVGVKALEETDLLVDLRSAEVPASAIVVAERVVGTVTDQVVVHLEVGPGGVRIGPPFAYRLTREPAGALTDAGGAPGRSETTPGDHAGSILIEPLEVKTATLAEVFFEDVTDVPIPDGPTDCASTSTDWPVERIVTVSSAPSGAVVTGYLIHVDVTHPHMGDLQIGFFHNPGTGSLLWNQGSGVNLSRDYTQDIYHHTLVGIGGEVNAYYMLTIRDCSAGSSGTLTYWSVHVYYDAPVTVDLVADSIATASTEVAPGGTLAATWSGHVAGSGSTGGPYTVGFYLSPDSNITTADVLLDQVSESSADTAGETFGQASPGRTLTIPAGTATGSYYLGLLVDSANVVEETNEANNVAWDTITVAPPAGTPNLRAISCSVSPTSAAPGATVTFTWRGDNPGTAAAGAFSWGVYLSTDATVNPASDTLVYGPQTSTGWAVGFDTGTVSQSVSLSSSLAAGSYYLGVVLDTAGAVTESNEGDNSCATAITVSSTPPTGVTHWLIPAVASAPGLSGSDWRSQISVVNPTGSSRSASLYFVAKGASWPGTLLSGPITVGANQSTFLQDPLLPLNPTTGLVYVTLDAAGPVATSRTYNLGGGGATYGQGIPALPLDGVAAPSELILPMVHSVPGRFHTNLGLVQTSSGSYQVEVTLYSTGGSPLAVKSYTRTAAYDQITDVFADMGLTTLSVEGAWMRVRLVSGSPTYWTCYASVVDDLTGDPTFVAPVEAE